MLFTTSASSSSAIVEISPSSLRRCHQLALTTNCQLPTWSSNSPIRVSWKVSRQRPRPSAVSLTWNSNTQEQASLRFLELPSKYLLGLVSPLLDQMVPANQHL